MNRWNIPDWLEQAVIARDRRCVYCGIEFASLEQSQGAKPTWEHIVNDARIINLQNIARCCRSCNASKGAKNLADWLGTAYCRRRYIHADSIAPVAKAALANPPSLHGSDRCDK